MFFTSKTYADVVAGRYIQTRYQPCSEEDMDKVAPYHENRKNMKKKNNKEKKRICFALLSWWRQRQIKMMTRKRDMKILSK